VPADRTSAGDLLAGGGPVGRDLLAVDWASTALGPPESWPRSLQTALRILLTSRFAMWMAWGPDLTFFCNESYRRDTLGTKYPWALGRPASEVWSEIWPDIGPRVERVMTTGEATWDESLLLFLERSGFVEESYHTFSYSPLADDDGITAGMLCVVKEDTAQVVSAQRLAALRDLSSSASGATSEADAIVSASAQLAAHARPLPFTLTYVFDADATTATRLGSSGFAGEHPAAPALLAVDDPAAAWPVAALAAGETVRVDDLVERFDDLPTAAWGAWDEPPSQALVVPLTQPGQEAPYGFVVAGLNRYRPVDDAYVGFVHLVAAQLATTITDARAYEVERRRAESLAALDRAKTDFFTNVSHEFRTPLTLLLGPVEDALDDVEEPLPPRQRERLEVVRRNGERLLKLVNSLLDFSRLEGGGIESVFEPTDLAQYTREVAAMFDAAFSRAGLTFTVECDPLPAVAYVDRDHWAKIVLNLVSNALKFTFEGGVVVRLRADGDAAVLTVADTGAGVPAEEMPRLFERFHRVHGTRSRTHEGSGIGLALVAELVDLHGGLVEAESVVDEGTTFTVRVPLGSSHLPADSVLDSPRREVLSSRDGGFVTEALRWFEPDEAVRAADVHEGAVASGAERARVLVVDDNNDMRDYIAGLLAPVYDVACAADGLEALALVDSFRPDLVLTDVMMPNLDGLALLERLASDPLTTGMPVVLVSARAGEEGTVEGLEAGASDYLVKPFSARELLARVRVNMELDRVRRVRSTLERSRALLDQTQRLAKVGSWEADLDTDELIASEEFLRLMGMREGDPERLGLTGVIDAFIHPGDRAVIRQALAEAGDGRVISYETRVVLPSGHEALMTVRAQHVDDESPGRRLVRGSVQDVTEQRRAEQTLADAAAREEASAREHAIAGELQRSLLPARSFDLEHIEVATFYRAGVEGTDVGGDWYDVIELGAGRSAFVIGDVMGRGVRAAAVMGQIRSAVRAYAKLDMAPSELLEHLDGIVQDLEGDQIVTCVYAVFDSRDQTLHYANAGHLPPLLTFTRGAGERLTAGGPPLGAGYFGVETETVQLEPASVVTFYTDGLVEHRGLDIDGGINALADEVAAHVSDRLEGLPEALVETLLPDGPDDDVAVLVARVHSQPFEAAVSHRLRATTGIAGEARELVAAQLREWHVPDLAAHDLLLMTSELVTNAVAHGRPPIDLRLRRMSHEVLLEVQDRAPQGPRRRRPAHGDEHGRGLQIVTMLADRWGSRPSGTGKSIWCTVSWSDDAG
jgi:PAS domain S-box-containing protein